MTNNKHSPASYFVDCCLEKKNIKLNKKMLKIVWKKKDIIEGGAPQPPDSRTFGSIMKIAEI